MLSSIDLEPAAMRPLFERLEDRVLLAANVSQKGSTLLVQFDGGGGAVTLTGTAEGAIDVAGADGGNGDYTGVKNIKIVGGAGMDGATLVDVRIKGGVSADMKGADDFLGISGADTNIQGNIKAKFGDGDDVFDVSANVDAGPIRIGKNVSVDLGNSVNLDQFTLFGQAGAEVITIGGGVTVKQQAGDSLVSINSARIAKNLSVDAGAGIDSVNVGNNVTDAALTTSAKGVTIKTGDGDDIVTIGGTHGTVAVARNLSIDLGNATGTDILAAIFDDSANQEFTVGGNVSIKGGAERQFLVLDGLVVGGNVKVSLGDGDDEIDLNQNGGDIAATIGKSLDVKLGSGDDVIDVERLAITRKVKVDGGAGNDTGNITADGTVTVGGKRSGSNFEDGNLQAALNA